MSFILDALKKSEKDRQRDAVPGISDLPVVVQRTRTSVAAVALIATMSVALLGLGWAWWRASSPAATAESAVPGRAAAPEAAPDPAEPRRAQAARPAATRSLAGEATRVAAVAAPRAPSDEVTSAGEPAGGIVRSGPMSILEARASGMAVPELTLELLVFSEEPSRRFVYINSAKYVEGDTLDDGPQLLEITTEGALLRYQGRNFLLPQN